MGDYVPFYFCFRSIMLYLLHKGNHVDLAYHDGERPIVHLEADLLSVVNWADSADRRWAFSKGNAGTRYTHFYDDLDQLALLDWDAISASVWKDPFVKEGKQAEFLVEDSIPWNMIERIGVIDSGMAERAASIVREARHAPEIVVAPSWYYS